MMSNGGNEFNVKDLINRVTVIPKCKSSKGCRFTVGICEQKKNFMEKNNK